MAKQTANGLGARFKLASEELTHRTVVSITGEVGAGKTYFTCTAPEPILIQNIDKGTEGVVEQFRKEGKEIYEVKYNWNPGDIEENDLQEAAIEVRNKWEKDYRYAVENGIRSVSWDTESRIWQSFRYAEFGSPKGDTPKDYDKLNQRFEALIDDAKSRTINLFLCRSMKDHWGLVGAVNRTTGKKSFGKAGREEWGYEHLPGLMFTQLFFRYDKEEGTYLIDIGKCRHNYKLQWKSVDRCSFPELGTLMIPGSSEEDWGGE